MDRPGATILLLIAVALVGCSSGELGDVPPHSQLRDGDLVEVSPTGELAVVAEVPDSAERAVVLADGIVVELDGSILRSEGADFVESSSGILLAADRRGQRYATFTEGVLTIHDEKLVDIPIDCDEPLAGVWDGSNTVVAVLCPEKLFVVSPVSGQVFSRSLPGIGVDISNWGEGFGVLVRSNDGLELYRTPCHEQDLFGLLYNVDNKDIINVVAGIEKEGWVALEGDGTLLNFTGTDFEVINDGIVDISEVPGVELEFECQLGAIGSS